jgi:hypothetical protein
MQRILLFLVLALAGAVVFLFLQVDRLQRSLPPTGAEGHEEEHVEVAEYMGRIHGYANKLWAAGNAGNGDLAAFYLHEIEEVMEELDGHHVIDDGVDISKHLKVYGLPAVEALTTHLRANKLADFALHHQNLLDNCNACHAISGYPQIRVVAPVVPPEGQDFTPQP